MQLTDLKLHIKNKDLTDSILIFQTTSGAEFIIDQYIDTIAKDKSLTVTYIDSITPSDDIFGLADVDQSLRILTIPEFTDTTSQYKKEKNLIIIATTISPEAKGTYSEEVVEFFKLPEWCIKDYVLARLPKVQEQKINWLLDTYHYDIFRLKNECDKFLGFPESQQDSLFNKFQQDNVFTGSSMFTIFDFTNAIMERKIQKLREILYELSDMDVEPLGVVTLLLKNFKQVINIQLGKNATAESLGITPKQFYMISTYRTHKYTNTELCDIYKLLITIDQKIKTGDMPVEILLNYIIVKVLIGK